MPHQRFEWDPAKAASNRARHAIAFEDAAKVFDDPGVLDDPDDTMDYGEDRYRAVGMVNGRLIAVFYTERGDRIRIISAARRRPRSNASMPDPTHRPDQAMPSADTTDWAAVDELTPAEVEAAALDDPDASPTPERAMLHPMAPVKRLRLRLGLGPQAFAARFHIPIDVLRAWERHAAEPDAVARAYLTAVAADPDGVATALATRPAAE